MHWFSNGPLQIATFWDWHCAIYFDYRVWYNPPGDLMTRLGWPSRKHVRNPQLCIKELRERAPIVTWPVLFFFFKHLRYVIPWRVEHISGQLMIFHQPRFPWNNMWIHAKHAHIVTHTHIHSTYHIHPPHIYRSISLVTFDQNQSDQGSEHPLTFKGGNVPFLPWRSPVVTVQCRKVDGYSRDPGEKVERCWQILILIHRKCRDFYI